jgi:hypothetical protein
VNGSLQRSLNLNSGCVPHRAIRSKCEFGPLESYTPTVIRIKWPGSMCGSGVPYTSKDIAADLNEAADKYFRDARVELNAIARRKVHVTRQNVRRALAELEDTGAAERQLSDGRPLSSLSVHQRKSLGQGEDLRLMFYLRPKLAAREEVAKQCDYLNMASFATLKPAVAFFRKLRIAFNADPKVVDMDYLTRETGVLISDYQKEHSTFIENYRKRAMVVIENAHKERKVESINNERNTPSSSSRVEPPEAEPSTTSVSVSSVLSNELPALLRHKGALTISQLSEVVAVISQLEEPDIAVRYFLDFYLPSRLRRSEHVGAVPAVTRSEFAATWPTHLREIQVGKWNGKSDMVDEGDRAAPFTLDELRAVLQTRQPNYRSGMVSQTSRSNSRHWHQIRALSTWIWTAWKPI